MTVEIILRRAKAGDAPRIAELSGQLGYPSSSKEMSDRLAVLSQDPAHAIIVAEPGDRSIQGWIHVMALMHLESGVFAEIAGLVVDESHRGKGAGKLLVDAGEKWAREFGCTTMTVRSNVVRSQTHNFYENLGYSVLKQQKVFKKSIK